MKQNETWPSRDAFRAIYPPQDEGYMRAVRHTLANLEGEREVQPKMKKKMTFAVVFAAALTVLLACTAVAAGMGVFGKIANQWAAWGVDAYMNALDERSVTVGQTQTVPADGVCPEVTLTLAQSYYDGESLYISYEGTGFGEVVDYAWSPTDEQFARMEIDLELDGMALAPGATPAVPTVMSPDMAVSQEGMQGAFVQRMLDTADKEGAAGAAVYDVYLSDGVYLSGTEEYLELSMSEDVPSQDGAIIGMREFQKPLLEAARAQDELALDVKVYRNVTYRYYDGEHWYILRDFANRQENIVTFTVRRNTEESAVVLAAERTFEDYRVEAEVAVSELKIRATLTVTNFAGTEVMPDEPKPGELCDYRVYVNGERASMLSGEFGAMAGGQIEMTLEFTLPQQPLQIISFVPQYADENDEMIERPEETVTFEIGE